ncbi:MAG: FeoB-associated Cys-rich membrane protein [Planctomycetota bacterium]|nr:FeoB-associated Cys-rich membrane protein [Planctomycetota bacterium]
MMPFIEQFLVTLIVGGAVIMTLRSVFKSVSGQGSGGCGCSHKAGCSASPVPESQAFEV